jgi:MFS transporter, NRE family, putaive nickel resistance protein
VKRLPRWLQGLENPIFARLYLAQTVNLIGDSLTWLGLALLAFELGGENSGTILAVTLTLRVTAYVVLSPLAGALADRIDRKRLMIVTHLARMGIVCLLPFVTQIWQIYALVLSLNVFSAFFTPTYTATIPLVTTKDSYSQAISLSSATYELLGVLGPGLAGGLAAWVGTRQVFFLDGITFLMAAILIVQLPGQLMVNQGSQTIKTARGSIRKTLEDIRTGTVCLFSDSPIRYALLLQLVAAIAGAAILVNTVGYVQGTLQLGKLEYGWAMAAFGIGATIASVSLGNAKQKINSVVVSSGGAILITLALFPANWVSLPGLLLLWALAGIGQTLINVPAQMLIADRVAVEAQGRVYGAHFAWSHFWWVFAYPLAGWTASYLPTTYFFYSSLIGFAMFALVYIVARPKKRADLASGLWHDHQHIHNNPQDEHYQHKHSSSAIAQNNHTHLHFHPLR